MRKLTILTAALAATLGGFPAPARAGAVVRTITPAVQLTGAIFTTDVTGTVVNGNIYNAKTDVYLNGGPQPNAPCSAAGLPDGDYYFQVTNPAGTLLLSSDAVTNRRASVLNGLFTATSGSHAVGTGKCPGAITVGLAPYNDTDNPGGEYKVWVTPVSSYQPTKGTFGFLPANSKTDNFKVKSVPQTQVAITGQKFYDANANGVWDAGEPVIPGWRVEKTPPTLAEVTYTSVSGQYGFVADANSGSYAITEIMPGASSASIWLPTRPTSGDVTVGITDVAGPDFGNVCLGAGGAKPIDYWVSCDSRGLIGADDLAMLRALNLRNANGSNFDPIYAYTVTNWLRGASATNMAYMLSAQLAVSELNVFNGFVNGGGMIYAPGAASANAFGFASLNAVMAEANTELGLHGSTLSGSPYRAYQETLNNILVNANNNLNYVQSAPCEFETPY